MNIVLRIGTLMVFMLGSSLACAAEGGEWKVVGIYVKESESLYLDAKLAPRKFHDAQRWAEVRKLQTADGASSVAEMVPVPSDITLTPGDIVQLDLPLKIKQIQGLLPERAKIVALIAKAGSTQAATIDSGNARVSMGSSAAR